MFANLIVPQQFARVQAFSIRLARLAGLNILMYLLSSRQIGLESGTHIRGGGGGGYL